VLTGEGGFGIDAAVLRKIAQEIKEVKILAWRSPLSLVEATSFGDGSECERMDRATADYMGDVPPS